MQAAIDGGEFVRGGLPVLGHRIGHSQLHRRVLRVDSFSVLLDLSREGRPVDGAAVLVESACRRWQAAYGGLAPVIRDVVAADHSSGSEVGADVRPRPRSSLSRRHKCGNTCGQMLLWRHDMPNPVPEADPKLQFFFASPKTDVQTHIAEGVGRASVLYLLRRELIETSGHDPNDVDEGEVIRLGAQDRLFATMILGFTVIDLLAKFTSDKSGIGERFREFLSSQDGGQLDKDSASLLWASRNSLVHQFNVPPEQTLKAAGLTAAGFGQRLENQLGIGVGLTVIARQGENAIVFVDGILATTFAAIKTYEDSLWGDGSADARRRFLLAYDEYGTMPMRIT
jgi:hypothetical protein